MEQDILAELVLILIIHDILPKLNINMTNEMYVCVLFTDQSQLLLIRVLKSIHFLLFHFVIDPVTAIPVKYFLENVN